MCRRNQDGVSQVALPSFDALTELRLFDCKLTRLANLAAIAGRLRVLHLAR
jgi:hypothetical protein